MAERVDHWKESFEDLRPILKTFYCHQILLCLGFCSTKYLGFCLEDKTNAVWSLGQQSANPQITSDWFAFTDYGNDSNKHI